SDVCSSDLHEIDGSIACRLSAYARTAIGHALAREYARLEAVGQALVLAEKVADLAPPDANVSGGNVGVLPDVMMKPGHERLAEPHDLALGLSLGIEISSALAAADRQAGQRVQIGRAHV